MPIQQSLHNTITRGKYKLIKPKFTKNIRKFTFRVCTVNMWNSLPDRVKDAETINTFKNRLDYVWKPLDIMFNFDRCLDFEAQHHNPDSVRSVNINYDLQI